ncbi:MAG: PTS sugar transporter subunit IIA [Candidatus Muiribacteriota bacterium]
MTLKESFRKQCVKCNINIDSKNSLLKEIASIAKTSGKLDNISEEVIYKALLEREKIGTTGFGDNIAIPHCRIDNISDFVVGVVTLENGVDFNSIDKKPVRLAVFLIGPESEKSKHIQVLSSIAKLLKSDDTKNKLIECKDTSSLERVFSENIEDNHDTNIKYEKTLFHIFIQNEEYFSDILELLSSVVEGSISVIETNNAGDYLHTMPLFSAYWSEDYKMFSRIIMAVVDRDYANEIITKIQTIVPDIDKKSGVLLTAQNVYYSCGSIDF